MILSILVFANQKAECIILSSGGWSSNWGGNLQGPQQICLDGVAEGAILHANSG